MLRCLLCYIIVSRRVEFIGLLPGRDHHLYFNIFSGPDYKNRNFIHVRATTTQKKIKAPVRDGILARGAVESRPNN
jgi:hypothetical protein